MAIVSAILVAVVALLHLWFAILEMLLWRRPLGLQTFRLTAERAEQTAQLAMNQGLYNAFVAAGLVVGLVAAEPIGLAFRLFFLGCAIVAGVFGAATVQRGILFVQALPAALALAAVLIVGS